MDVLETSEVRGPSHAKDAGEFRHMRSRCPTCGIDRKRRWAKVLNADETAEIDKEIREKSKIESQVAL